MDIKKYIASGILENYVLGLVSDAESREVEQNLLQYPELKAELNTIEDALGAYAQAKAIPMPAGLSAQILQSIENLESGASSSSDTTNTGSKPGPTPSKPFNTLGLILGIALAGSLLGNFFLNQQKQETTTQLAQVQTELKQTNSDFLAFQLTCNQKEKNYQEEIATIKGLICKVVQMKGTDKAPEAIASIYNHPNTSKSYLDIGNLPPPPADKEYQLWAIIDGAPAPLSMKIFDLSEISKSILEVTHFGKVKTYAVTLELKNRADKNTPNLAELYVIGNV